MLLFKFPLSKQDNNLWVSALQHFAHSSSSKNSEYIKETLDYIERYNLLPPLMVIEILSKSKHTKLGDVKVSGCSLSYILMGVSTSLMGVSTSPH